MRTKISTKPLCLILALGLVLSILAGCGGRGAGEAAFTYSGGLDERGFWEGIKALDYVGGFYYQGIQIPADYHLITDENIQNELAYLLEEYHLYDHVTDRAVRDGDVVNIDYVGSVDGVEFDNGSTEGMGTYVTIGETEYIDDFLEQLIGHMPGDTVHVEVTFPDVYHAPELEGKDALFVTTINFIEVPQEIEDDFVAENLSPIYGWMTVEEMKGEIRTELQRMSMRQYIQQYFVTEVPIQSVPERITKYQEGLMLAYYQEYADMYEMELHDFLILYVGYASKDELIESNLENINTEARFSLVIQAVAEDAGISVDDMDMVNYMGRSDYGDLAEQYGLPYLKQYALIQKVLDFVIASAVLL